MVSYVARWVLSLAATACLSLSAAANASTAVRSARATIPLTSGWKFKLGEAAGSPSGTTASEGWQSVSVPHTWNRVGYYLNDPASHINRAENVNKAQGVGWYQLTFRSPPRGSNKRAWLQFDAASRTAEVWLNGVKLGDHKGGFSRFRFDATQAIRAGQDNMLVVKVDNTQPTAASGAWATLPLTGDFFIHGGLYRPVSLIVTDQVHLDMLDHGGPGVYAATTSIAGGGAKLQVRTRVRNDAAMPGGVRLVTILLDAAGRVAARSEEPLALQANAGAERDQQLSVTRAHLWQGVADPYLYTLRTEVRSASGQLLDTLEQPFGIRQMRLDPEQGFFLNGKSVRLHGVGLHQDWEGKGWALSPQDVASTVAILREMGANTIRLTHYQHGQPIHDIADRTGIVLWDEISLVTAWTFGENPNPPPALLANALQQLQELIRQNYNHPSVAVWGISNEVDFGPGRPDFLGRPPAAVPDPMPMLRELNALAKSEDPTRPTVLANCCEERGLTGVPDVVNAVDAAGANRYFGWYYGKPEELSAHLDLLRAKHPRQPLAVSEYGAGADFGIHTDDPLGGPIESGGRIQPEEYQSWVHEQTWKVLKSKPYLWSTWLWNGFDFGSTVRREGDTQDINTKGLVSYDRKIRKDAFYFYKANWTSTPTVHVNGRRYADRAYPVTEVRVYSNAPVTTLSVNGRSQGSKRDCPDRVCVWTGVRLATGTNQIAATGRFGKAAVTDQITWRLAGGTGSFRIDSGSVIAAPGTTGFGSDAFYDGGAPGSTDIAGGRGRAPVLASIRTTGNRDLAASFREGDFHYRLPLAPGRFTVELTFVEPKPAAGTRRFNVLANGQTELSNFDVAGAAGGALIEVRRRFEVSAGAEGLDLHFQPVAGNAIVSAVEVTPRS